MWSLTSAMSTKLGPDATKRVLGTVVAELMEEEEEEEEEKEA